MGLVLTFDEFGMWLHLGGPYWQRASFDAVVLIAAVIALLAFAPDVRRGSRQRWVEAGLLVLVLSVFGVTLLSESHCPDHCVTPLRSSRRSCTR